MDVKELGLSGIMVSSVGLGCNSFGRRIDAAEARDVVHGALDAGITLFDTAESYGDGASETYLGKALGARRRDVVIATKFGWGGRHDRGTIEKAIEGSLRRLGTDYVDLYQIHRPDASTPIAETLEALDRLVRTGKVRAIGCSNFSAAQLADAMEVSRGHNLAAFVTAQNEYSLLRREIEADLVPVCLQNRVGILPYYPLCGGLLTGKYRRGVTPGKGTRLGDGGIGTGGWLTGANFDVVERLEAFTGARAHELIELAISWLAMKPEIASVIAGARRPGQPSANVEAGQWVLTAADLEELNRLV
ncbi:MAG: aldo/keto reductase [Pseudomonadota bacterium]|nr:aldo/keto reductase [Pseudomonadota bacterium]